MKILEPPYFSAYFLVEVEMAYSQYLLIIIYIFALILGTVVTTLAFIFSVKNRTELNVKLRVFSIAFLLYTIFEFGIYYLTNTTIRVSALNFLIHACNICYFIYIIYWVLILQVLSDKFIIKEKAIKIFTLFYAIFAEGVGLVLYYFDPATNFYGIKEGLGKDLLSVGNFLYGLLIIYLASRFIHYAFTKMERSKKRNAVFSFAILLFVYMLWIIWWDYNIVNGQIIEPNGGYSIDPLIFVYIIQCLGIVWFFLNKDPLAVTEIGKNKFLQNQKAAQGLDFGNLEDELSNFDLTKREVEVVELALKGFSNPQIGKELYIAENTVKRHLSHIFFKLNVKNRYELLSLLSRK